MIIKNNILLFFVLAFALVSCGEKPMYTKAVSFKDNRWNLDQKPTFEVDIEDTTKAYNFRLILRTTTDYAYSNLWIFLKTIAPDGSEGREPYQIRIANEDGSWIGNKSGSMVETELSFAARKLPLKGKYTFIVEQAITKDEVDDVSDLIFEVSPVQN